MMYGSSLWYMVWFFFVIHGVVFCVQNVPPDLSICAFVLEQSLSVRALQEMLANTEEKAEGVSRLLQSWRFHAYPHTQTDYQRIQMTPTQEQPTQLRYEQAMGFVSLYQTKSLGMNS